MFHQENCRFQPTRIKYGTVCAKFTDPGEKKGLLIPPSNDTLHKDFLFQLARLYIPIKMANAQVVLKLKYSPSRLIQLILYPNYTSIIYWLNPDHSGLLPTPQIQGKKMVNKETKWQVSALLAMMHLQGLQRPCFCCLIPMSDAHFSICSLVKSEIVGQSLFPIQATSAVVFFLVHVPFISIILTYSHIFSHILTYSHRFLVHSEVQATSSRPAATPPEDRPSFG